MLPESSAWDSFDDDGLRDVRLDDVVHLVIKSTGGERYVFKFTDEYRNEAYAAVCRWAENPALSFTWQDAKDVTQKIHRIEEGR